MPTPLATIMRGMAVGWLRVFGMPQGLESAISFSCTSPLYTGPALILTKVAMSE